MTHSVDYLKEVIEIARLLPAEQIEALVGELKALRERGGRLFLVGLGGSAANCSHAVNDFRKLCGIEAYTPVDNVSELTARANDEGWVSIFDGWLAEFELHGYFNDNQDALMVLSVGGGPTQYSEQGVSVPIHEAINHAGQKRMKILGVVGRDGGFTKQVGDTVVVIPTVNPKHVTPHTEAFQMVVL